MWKSKWLSSCHKSSYQPVVPTIIINFTSSSFSTLKAKIKEKCHLKITCMVIEGVVAEVHQARDLDCHFYIESHHFWPEKETLAALPQIFFTLPGNSQTSHFTEYVMLLELLNWKYVKNVARYGLCFNFPQKSYHQIIIHATYLQAVDLEVRFPEQVQSLGVLCALVGWAAHGVQPDRVFLNTHNYCYSQHHCRHFHHCSRRSTRQGFSEHT